MCLLLFVFLPTEGGNMRINGEIVSYDALPESMASGGIQL